MRLLVGERVPASLQLFDADDTKFIRAIVRDENNAVIATLPLTHIVNGFYSNFTLIAPLSQVLSVQYMVYEDADYTDLSESHSIDLDIFSLTAIPPTVAQIANGVWDSLLSDHTNANTMGNKINQTITPASYIVAGQQIEIEIETVQLIEIEVEEI